MILVCTLARCKFNLKTWLFIYLFIYLWYVFLVKLSIFFFHIHMNVLIYRSIDVRGYVILPVLK